MLLLSSLPIAALLTFATPAAAAVAPRQASASASSSIPSVASSAVTSVASISSAASAASSSGSSSVPLPTGTAWPDPDGNSGRRIRLYGHDDLCLTVQNGTAKPGTPIELSFAVPNDNPYAQYQLWDNNLTYNQTAQIRLHANNSLCLAMATAPTVTLQECGSAQPNGGWQYSAGDERHLTFTTGGGLSVANIGKSGGSPYGSEASLAVKLYGSSAYQQWYTQNSNSTSAGFRRINSWPINALAAARSWL